MNSNEIVDNLNGIRTVAVQVQTFIHGVCGQITDSMKLYDLKLKEIEVLEKKIREERQQLTLKPHAKPNKTRRLKAKLKQEKAKVSRTVQNVVGHQNKLIVYK
jgi:23S rRNA pseudoU1915 N3-methylase RlmH